MTDFLQSASQTWLTPWTIGSAVAFLATFIPASWLEKLKVLISKVPAIDLDGPDTAVDAAKVVIERKQANCKKIANLRQQIDTLEEDNRRCDALVLKDGGEA